MKTLFPEMDEEIREGRRAERRAQVQLARNYLRDRDIVWIVNELLEHGPQTEGELIMRAMDLPARDDTFVHKVAEILFDLYSLWMVGKLWRRSQGTHFGSGEESFLYGIRRVHPVPAVQHVQPDFAL